VSEGGIRVPMILRWDGKLPAGKVYGEMVSSLDILPTAVAAAGSKIDPVWKFDGEDLLPYLLGEEEGVPHEWLFWRMGEEWAARHGKWKLYKNGGSGYGGKPDPKDNTWMLYDLSVDPGEKKDVKGEYPDLYQEMVEQWNEWNSQQAQPLWRFGGSGQMGQWNEE
jgi:arylsulfatase A-like enzyme